MVAAQSGQLTSSLPTPLPRSVSMIVPTDRYSAIARNLIDGTHIPNAVGINIVTELISARTLVAMLARFSGLIHTPHTCNRKTEVDWHD